MDHERHWQRDLEGALEQISDTFMPYGKFGPSRFPPRGVPIYDLPLEYLLVLRRRGFPKGCMGELLQVVCQIKLDGSEAVFQPFRDARGGRHSLRIGPQRRFEFPE